MATRVVDTTSIRWGILDTGRPYLRLKNINDKNIDSRKKKIEQIFHIESQESYVHLSVKVYKSWKSLVLSSDIDAINVEILNDNDFKWLIKAIDAGKHIVLESPIILNVSQILLIKDRAAKQNVKVQEGFLNYFHQQYSRIKELLETSIIGQVENVKASYSFSKALMRKDIKDFGATRQIGPHLIHTFRGFFGFNAKTVNAVVQTIEDGIDLSVSGSFDFGRGKNGQFNICFDEKPKFDYLIIGTRGIIRCQKQWHGPANNYEISCWADNGINFTEHYEQNLCYLFELNHFSSHIHNHSAATLSLFDGHYNFVTYQALIDSIVRSKTILI